MKTLTRNRRGNTRLMAMVLLAAASGAGVSRTAGAAGGTLVVLNKSEATASLIDLSRGETVATVPTGNGPHEVAVSPDGTTAIATNYGTRDAPGSTLTVIDVPHARVVRTIDLGEYHRPHGVQWLADGKQVVVTSEESHKLLTVDVGRGKVTATADTGQETSHMVCVTPDGTRAFVANIGSGSVSVIDMATGKRLSAIETGDGAEGITVSPDGTQVWVTNRGADTVTVLDAHSLDVLKELPSSSFPIRAKVTPDGRHALVSNARSGEVAVFDTHTLEEVRRISMKLDAADTEGRLFGHRFGDSSVPIGILIRPDGKVAYVANANADIISIIDLTTWKTAGVLHPGREPDGMAYSRLTVASAG
ncbi:MAG: cytochrome D1 domain-containing protein [Acidobacteriota bacterium]